MRDTTSGVETRTDSQKRSELKALPSAGLFYWQVAGQPTGVTRMKKAGPEGPAGDEVVWPNERATGGIT